VDVTDRSRVFDDLTTAMAELHDFLAGHPGSERLTAREMHTLERLAERYDRAHDALNQEIERVVRRSTGRPRR
jgi:hypothetical protein